MDQAAQEQRSSQMEAYQRTFLLNSKSKQMQQTAGENETMQLNGENKERIPSIPGFMQDMQKSPPS
jgi:hypothetical protein